VVFRGSVFFCQPSFGAFKPPVTLHWQQKVLSEKTYRKSLLNKFFVALNAKKPYFSVRLLLLAEWTGLEPSSHLFEYQLFITLKIKKPSYRSPFNLSYFELF